MIDLRPDHLEIVRDLLRQHVPGCEVRAFGSRFKWTAKQASDLDLAVVGTKRLPTKKIMRLKEAFEESILPMRVDVLDWHAISPEFQRVIDAGFEVIQGGEVSPLAPAASNAASATPLSGENPRNAPNVLIERNNWAEVELQELANEITVGFVGSMASEYVDDGIPFLRSQNIDPLCVNLNDLKYITQAFHEKIKKSKLTPGDVVIVRTGKPGACAVIPEWLNEANCSDIVIVRCGPRINNHYLAYYVNTAASHHISSHIVGAVQQHFNVGAARTLKVKLPPLSIQNSIVKILGTLDDRIELCRRTNETLESTARALFKDWFIDFGPVRAKLEGGEPYLSADVWSLFPDRFVDSELGEIPDSWTSATLKELTVKIGSGSTPRGGSEVYIDSGISLIRSQNVYDSNFVWDGLAYITDSAAEQLKNVTLELEDVLINITGASILRTCVVEPATLPARVNQHVAIIRAKPEIPSRYLHLHLLQKSTKDFLMGMNAGASREAVTKAHLESTPIIRPSDKVLAEFKNSTAPLFNQIQQSNDSIRMLSSLRDNLLPKLLSGELSIPETMLEAQVSG